MNYNEYEDKVALNENVEIPNINKVTDDDMNYIKYNLPHVSQEEDNSYTTNILHSKNILDKYQATTYSIEAYLTPISTGIKATTPTGRNYSFATIDLGALNDYVGKKIYFKFKVNTTNAGRIYIGKSNVGQTSRTALLDSGTIYNGDYEFETNIISVDNSKPRLFIAIYANGLGNNVDANAYTDYTNLIVSTEDVPYEDYTTNQIITNGDDFSYGVGVGNNTDIRNKVNFVKSRNVFSSEIRNGNVSDTQINSATNRICSKTFIKVKPSTQYVLTFSGSLGQINISYFTGSSFPRESESGWTSTFTFTTKSNTNFIMISWRKSSNNEDITPADISNIMLSEGNTALTYEHYGTSINVDGEDIYNQNIMNYSTSETRIGTWLGKPLYRKVVNIGSLPNSTSKNVSTGLSNIDTMCKLYGTAYGSGNMLPIPHASASSIASSIGAFLTNNYGTLTIQTGSDRSSYQGYVIVEYTKTTD